MMLRKLQNNLWVLMQKNHISLDKDIYDYGFTTLYNYSIFMLIIIPISICFHVLFETIIFIITFLPIRRFLGGFHFNKNYLCLFFSVIIPITFGKIAQYYIIRNIFLIIAICTLIILITFKSEVKDHPNKRISVEEKISIK